VAFEVIVDYFGENYCYCLIKLMV